MKKLFTLFDKEDVLLSPGEKIIPAGEYTSYMTAKELIDKAKQKIFEEEKKAREEAKKAYEKAKEEGFQEGLEKFNEHLLALDRLIKTIQKDINKKVLPLALKAARKILGEELKLNPQRIVEIVAQALKPVVQHHRIKIYVNKEDLNVLESHKSKLKKPLQQLESFIIEERSDIEQGGCVIETEAGIINAQLENQWRALEAAFETFLKK